MRPGVNGWTVRRFLFLPLASFRQMGVRGEVQPPTVLPQSLGSVFCSGAYGPRVPRVSWGLPINVPSNALPSLLCRRIAGGGVLHVRVPVPKKNLRNVPLCLLTLVRKRLVRRRFSFFFATSIRMFPDRRPEVGRPATVRGPAKPGGCVQKPAGRREETGDGPLSSAHLGSGNHLVTGSLQGRVLHRTRLSVLARRKVTALLVQILRASRPKAERLALAAALFLKGPHASKISWLASPGGEVTASYTNPPGHAKPGWCVQMTCAARKAVVDALLFSAPPGTTSRYCVTVPRKAEESRIQIAMRGQEEWDVVGLWVQTRLYLFCPRAEKKHGWPGGGYEAARNR